MNRWMKAAVVGFASAACAAPVLAQPVPIGWKYIQPWSPPRAAFESRVRSCAQPTPLNVVAMDDWICGQTGGIARITWWGTLSSPAQGQRPFYIAIYGTAAGACVPNLQQRLYSTCVIPDYSKYVGTDCQQRRVFRLSAPLPATLPFVQQQGTHYWLQISEADVESIRPNLEDFRWSGHRPIVNCPAVQTPPSFVTPLRDACDQQPDDLAFGLQSRDISGVLTPAGSLIRPVVFVMEIRSLEGDLLETLCLEPDDNGHFFGAPEVPDGDYIAVIRGGGLVSRSQPITLADGQCTMASFFDVFYGDLDGDGSVRLTDLSMLLSGFGLTGVP